MLSFKIRFSNGDVKPVSDVPQESTVEETKAILQSLGICDVAVEQQRLIFKGRILANEQTLQEAGVQEGNTLHFVKASPKSAPAQAPQAPQSSAPPTATTAGGGGFADLFGGGVRAEGGGNEAQGRMMMNMLQSNPAIRNMMERNPEVARMLNSPEAMQQMMQMNNPAMRDEILRNHDRQLANLESIPGGQAALLRMMNEVGDVDSVFDQTPSQPTVTRPNASPPANGRPEAAPMPNPWSTPAMAAPTAQRQAGSNPWAPGGGGGAGGMGELPDMRMMQQMMQQPAMQQRLEEMMRNPEMMQQQMQMMQQMLGNDGMAQLQQRAMQMMNQPGAMEELQQRMQGMSGPPASGGGANPFATFAANNNNQPPEVRFVDQLSQLEGMGFTDRAQNVRALVATNGNVNAAVERLLM